MRPPCPTWRSMGTSSFRYRSITLLLRQSYDGGNQWLWSTNPTSEMRRLLLASTIGPEPRWRPNTCSGWATARSAFCSEDCRSIRLPVNEAVQKSTGLRSASLEIACVGSKMRSSNTTSTWRMSSTGRQAETILTQGVMQGSTCSNVTLNSRHCSASATNWRSEQLKPDSGSAANYQTNSRLSASMTSPEQRHGIHLSPP